MFNLPPDFLQRLMEMSPEKMDMAAMAAAQGAAPPDPKMLDESLVQIRNQMTLPPGVAGAQQAAMGPGMGPPSVMPGAPPQGAMGQLGQQLMAPGGQVPTLGPFNHSGQLPGRTPQPPGDPRAGMMELAQYLQPPQKEKAPVVSAAGGARSGGAQNAQRVMESPDVQRQRIATLAQLLGR